MFNIDKCKKTGVVRVLNPPTDQELTKIYSEEYYKSDKPDYISTYYEDKDWWFEVYRYRLRIMERYVTSLEDNKRLLDIGSGPGLLLECAEELGWAAKGYEPNKDAFDFSKSRGLTVKNEYFTGEKEGYDFIYLGEVLEHIKDIEGFITMIYDSLPEGGVLAIVVPNDGTIIHEVLTEGMGYNKWYLAPPYHLNYFTVTSLGNFLKKSGFDVVHTETTFSIETMLLLGENYLQDSSLGRKWHKRRMDWETKLLRNRPDLYEKLYTNNATIGLGREIFMVVRKPSCND